MDNYLTSANVWAIVWALIGILLTIGASMLSARLLFPEFSRRCAFSVGRPWRSGLLGAAAAAVAALLMGVFQRVGAPLPMILLGGTTFLLAVAGASGFIVRMARGSARPGEDPEAWTALRRSATVLSITFLLPVAGTFVALPLVLLCGLGSALQSLFARGTSPAAPEPASGMPSVPSLPGIYPSVPS